MAMLLPAAMIVGVRALSMGHQDTNLMKWDGQADDRSFVTNECTYEPTKIMDARKLQIYSDSKSAFFSRYGFVLMPGGDSAHANASATLASLFPGAKVTIFQDNPPSIRGPGHEAYLGGNHQDTTMNFSGFLHDHPDALEYSANQDTLHFLNFWGPCGMNSPLTHKPLVMADPHTVSLDDVSVSVLSKLFYDDGDTQSCKYGSCSTMSGHEPRGHVIERTEEYQGDLGPDANQRWYWYPDMLTSEFMVFTHFTYHKGDGRSTPYMRGNFHCSPENPKQPEGAERRRSCERRMIVGVRYVN